VRDDLRVETYAFLLASLLTMGGIASACGGATHGSTAPTSGPSAVQPSGSLPASRSCSAAEAQWTVGQQRSEDLLERARVAANATVARFLLPNQPITMEYLGSRLNLELDERNLVRAASCG
jgi:hypothetical protein